MIVTNGIVFKDGKWRTGLDLFIENGVFADVKPKGTVHDGVIIDAQNAYIAPGFIDIHVHGSHGSDVMDGNTAALKNISTFIASHGTTSFLPTTMSYAIEGIQQSVSVAASYMQGNEKGAQVLGVHLEGPFLNPKAKGAHPEHFIIPPTLEAFEAITQGAPHVVRLVTMAPESDGAFDFAGFLKSEGVAVSIGHTTASYDLCTQAIHHGMHHTCHFYNAMTPLRHREPGVVGAVLDHDESTIELIADLIHVHPTALRLAARSKGSSRTVLITDAMAAAGLGDGDYELGGLKVIVRHGTARLEDGTLAGSTLTQDQALRNMVQIGVPLEDVIRMLTETPARVIGVGHFKGRLEKGYDADFVLLDKELNVISAYVKGIQQ